MSWLDVPISEFCTTGSGSTPSRTKASRYYGGSIPWVKSGELREDVVCKTKEYVTTDALNETAIKLVPSGSLLIAMYGATVGRMAVLGIEATTNQAVCHIIPDDRKADIGYLQYALSNKIPYLLDKRVGGGQPNISQQIIKDTKIPLPPLAEQKRIAAILNKADAIRKKRQQTINLTEDFLRSAFVELFGDPVTNPKGWEIRPLGELAENKDSLRVPIKQSDRDLRSGKYPYYGSVGVIDDIDDYLYEGQHLLISEDGKHLETRNRPIACLASGRFWVNNHAHVLAFNGEADLIFLAHLLELYPIRQFVTGIDQFKLNRKNMDIIPVPLPPLKLQQHFANIVEKVEQQRIQLRKQLAELDALFASSQQRAFIGEL